MNDLFLAVVFLMCVFLFFFLYMSDIFFSFQIFLLFSPVSPAPVFPTIWYQNPEATNILKI